MDLVRSVDLVLLGLEQEQILSQDLNLSAKYFEQNRSMILMATCHWQDTTVELRDSELINIASADNHCTMCQAIELRS